MCLVSPPPRERWDMGPRPGPNPRLPHVLRHVRALPPRSRRVLFRAAAGYCPAAAEQPPSWRRTARARVARL